LANDWDEVCDVAAHNALLRAKVNKLIGNIWSAKKRKDKEEIKIRALASADAFNTLLETIHGINAAHMTWSKTPKAYWFAPNSRRGCEKVSVETIST